MDPFPLLAGAGVEPVSTTCPSSVRSISPSSSSATGAARVQALTTAPSGRLVAWDLDDGIYSFNADGTGILGETPFFPGSQSIQSLAYGPDATLFGSSATRTSAQAFGPEGWYAFDNSFTPAFVGDHLTPFEMRGLAYIPAPGVMVVPAVGTSLIVRRRSRRKFEGQVLHYFLHRNIRGV